MITQSLNRGVSKGKREIIDREHSQHCRCGEPSCTNPTKEQTHLHTQPTPAQVQCIIIVVGSAASATVAAASTVPSNETMPPAAQRDTPRCGASRKARRCITVHCHANPARRDTTTHSGTRPCSHPTRVSQQHGLAFCFCGPHATRRHPSRRRARCSSTCSRRPRCPRLIHASAPRQPGGPRGGRGTRPTRCQCCDPREALSGQGRWPAGSRTRTRAPPSRIPNLRPWGIRFVRLVDGSLLASSWGPTLRVSGDDCPSSNAPFAFAVG